MKQDKALRVYGGPDNIIDPDGLPVGSKPADVPGIVETIIPYFPEDEEKRRYLALISSGYTRREALRKCKKSENQLVEWREQDSDFAYLDDQGYSSLRDTVANFYFELLVRRNAVQILELDQTIFGTIVEKIDNGIPLTNDEKLIYSKRAATYTPESLQKLTNLVSGQGEGGGGIIDFVALVKGRVQG